ncbi:MAG: hypothetical protein EKK61_02765 [Rickettsiales bacterium]|nr:MAG: hypothetical protein EKK61_02765 [Rickettsiales bacterium]
MTLKTSDQEFLKLLESTNSENLNCDSINDATAILKQNNFKDFVLTESESGDFEINRILKG